MADSERTCWLVLQSKESRYVDREGASYEYPRHIANARKVAQGDLFVVALPASDAPDGRRILGAGRVGTIVPAGEDRLEARFDRWLRLTEPASFEEIGGDPR